MPNSKCYLLPFQARNSNNKTGLASCLVFFAETQFVLFITSGTLC